MPIAHLDYKPTKLQMEVTNPIEEQWRVRAVAKEPWTVEFIEQIPQGAVFWDVGANVGSYALIAASRGLTTVALEPGFNNYAALCRNLALNNLLERSVPLCLALSDNNRFDWFHYQDLRQGAASHVLGGIRKHTFHKQVIMVWAWDELANIVPVPPDAPHFAKLDLDGGELLALKGAPKLLSRLRALSVELHTADRAEVIAHLAIAGLPLVREITERDGKPMTGISCGQFARAEG